MPRWQSSIESLPAVGPAYFSAAGANLPRCTQISRSASGATRQFPTPGCAQTFHDAKGACHKFVGSSGFVFLCCSAAGSAFFPQPALIFRAVRKSFRPLRGRRGEFPHRAVRQLFTAQRGFARRCYAATFVGECSCGRLFEFPAAGALHKPFTQQSKPSNADRPAPSEYCRAIAAVADAAGAHTSRGWRSLSCFHPVTMSPAPHDIS